MVVISIEPHADFGRIDHRENAPHFTSSYLPILLGPILVLIFLPFQYRLPSSLEIL